VRRGLISTFLHLLGNLVRLQRSPVRFQALKDKSFSNTILRLFKMSHDASANAGPQPEVPKELSNWEEITALLSVIKERTSWNPQRVVLGDKVYSFTCAFLQAVIHNQPSYLKTLHSEGVTEGFLGTLGPVSRLGWRCGVACLT
jgi:hypothetical protein